MPATNFHEFTATVADETPVGLVLDQYRRLELAARAYYKARALRFKDGRAAEIVFAADPNLGPDVANEFAHLRRMRNAIAHEHSYLAGEEAIVYAHRALTLIGRLGLAEDAVARQPADTR